DLARDLPERDADLGRFAAKALDLGQEALETPPVGLELGHASVGLDDLVDRGLALSAFEGVLSPTQFVADRDPGAGPLERLAPFAELREAAVDQVIALRLEPGLRRAQRGQRLRDASVGLAQRRLTELVRQVRSAASQFSHEFHLGTEVAADRCVEVLLRR